MPLMILHLASIITVTYCFLHDGELSPWHGIGPFDEAMGRLPSPLALLKHIFTDPWICSDPLFSAAGGGSGPDNQPRTDTESQTRLYDGPGYMTVFVSVDCHSDELILNLLPSSSGWLCGLPGWTFALGFPDHFVEGGLYVLFALSWFIFWSVGCVALFRSEFWMKLLKV